MIGSHVRGTRLLVCSVLGMLAVHPVAGHGDLHDQIAGVTAQIQTAPARADLYLKRAGLHFHHQEWSEAASDYDRAEKLDPALQAVHLGRAKLFMAMGRHDPAKCEIEKFLAENPSHREALLTRGRIEVAGGRPLPAVADFAKVIELSPQPEPEFYIEQARALASAGGSHVEEAIGVLDAGTAKLGNLPAMGLLAIELEVRLKQFDAALDRVDRLSQRSPRKDPWLERRGDILTLAGRSTEALKCYRAAAEAIASLPVNVRETKAAKERAATLARKLAPPNPVESPKTPPP